MIGFWVWIPFIVQGAAILVDEFYFHYERAPLPKWERWGHPLDTLTLVVCVGMAAFFPFTRDKGFLFWSLAAFSCLWITKDEWVHASRCRPAEHWLHAILFIIHPISLLTVGLIWKDGYDTWLLKAVFASLLTFFAYQTIYWNVFFHSNRADEAHE